MSRYKAQHYLKEYNKVQTLATKMYNLQHLIKNYQAYKRRKILPVNSRKSRIKAELQVKEMIELANKVIKTTNINMLHLFKQVEENMNIMMINGKYKKGLKWNL